MSTPILSARASALLAALNRRGIRGPIARTFLRRFSQARVARQIDYYDHEVVFRAKLPEWAATPWLAHRVRHDVPAPKDFLSSSESLSRRLREIPYRPPRYDGGAASQKEAAALSV